MPARHKGIHTDSFLDHFWPHHAVIPWENCCEKNYDPAHSRAHEMNCADRHAFIRKGDKDYLAFRFKEPFQADRMAQEFGGETYCALDRSKGSGWEKWRRKSTPNKFAKYG
ncbi:hypothetical protein [Mesorhizobium sp. LSJC264A00]|uniref:hypothetical protein n=1 Tax=unclassified Mesorhizobium TaxID=325217 RepID=UPI0003CE7A0F|nr:hypothetical protein [Mesorhizobium sp. LSJC264A00]ESX24169.1 hypothetical protein X767_13165 [Mesorhizobium sp. LSJC264A00]